MDHPNPGSPAAIALDVAVIVLTLLAVGVLWATLSIGKLLTGFDIDLP